jgi:Neuraminidase (sialidase)
MKIIERGTLNLGEPGTRRAISTFPTVTTLADGTLLASYRVGTTKDSDDETIELRRSRDGGRNWSDPVTPFTSVVDGRRGSLKVGYMTPLGGDHLIASSLWVDRQAFPGKPLFNDKTEGCLPMQVLFADSNDSGRTWSSWRVLPLPKGFGPPSLTCPILRLADGRLAVSIETNKDYLDTTRWFQHVVYCYSGDLGKTWGPPVTVCQDPTARIFHWDQRAGVLPDGRLVTFTWTYDRDETRYLNVHRRLSSDGGGTWSAGEDLGFTDQPSRPAILPDGRVVVAWVDRFQTRTIRARLAERCDAPFLPETEVVLYELSANGQDPTGKAGTTGDLLAEMGVWNFGLPYAEALPDGNVLIVYYEGVPTSMRIRWARLSL